MGTRKLTINTPTLFAIAIALVATLGVPPLGKAVTSPQIQVASRIEIPVTWRVTRARFLASGRAAQTESYRDTWILERWPGGATYLKSSKSQIRVEPTPNKNLHGANNATLYLRETELAQLLGMARNQAATEDTIATPPTISATSDSPDTPQAMDPQTPAQDNQSPILELPLGELNRSAKEFNLKINDDDQIKVMLQIGADSHF